MVKGYHLYTTDGFPNTPLCMHLRILLGCDPEKVLDCIVHATEPSQMNERKILSLAPNNHTNWM